jgi:uncharacterized protein YndB with AHSA1/START domain
MTKESDAPPTNTLQLHRHFRAPAERVYKAFLDPAAMVKWLPPHGFTGTVHSMDAIEGGLCKMSFTNFGTGASHSFTSKYVKLVPYTFIQYVDEFDDPALAGEMGVTIELEEGMAGTFVTITQRGIPAQIPVEFATMGWQESLQMLEQLVVPEIPDGSPEA